MKLRILTLAFCVLSLSATAQKKLSLAEAIQIGLENNYDIRIETRNIEVARNNNALGEAGFLPDLTLSLTQSNRVTNIDNPTAFVGGDIVNVGINPVVNLNWTLFDGFRAQITKSRLENLQKDTEGNAAIVVQNTIQAIIQGYYTAVLEKERLKVFQRSLDLSREKYDYVKLKKDLGSAVTTDLLLEESNYLNDSTAYINQILTYRQALRTLNILLAEENINTDYQFTNSLTFEEIEYQLTLLYDKMTANNVNLKRQYVSQAILRDAVGIARAGMYPRVDLNLNFSDNISSQDVSGSTLSDAPQVPVTGTTINYGATFTITFNLFNGGRIKRAIQNAIIQEEIGNLRIENLELSLKRDMEAALDLYNTRRQLKGIATRTKEQAELNLSISEERYRSGTINSFDYRTVQNTYINAALSELQAIYNLIDANTQILRLSGGLVEEDE